MRTRRKCLATSLPLSISLLLLIAATTSVAFENDFSQYPQGSQNCLYDAANKSNCNGDTVEAMNKCLCGNGSNFALNAAACISKADNSNLQKVYTTMADACEFSNTPLEVTQKDFLNAGSSSSPTSGGPSTRVSTAVKTISGQVTTVTTSLTATPSVTTYTTTSDGQTQTITSTSDPAAQTDEVNNNNNSNNSNNNGDGGMSSTARIGIIAGATVAGIAILAAIVFFILRYLRSRNAPPKDESHPMLAQPKWGPSPSNDPNSRHTSGDMTAYAAQQEWKQDGSGATWRPSQDHWSAMNSPGQQQQWDAGQYHSNWGAGTSPPPQHTWGYSPGAAYQQYGPPQPTAYELAGPEPTRPTEMPASSRQQGGGMQHPMHAQHSPHSTQGWTTYSGR